MASSSTRPHRGHGPSLADADDIYQQVFEKLFRKRFESWDRDQLLRPWVKRIAFNTTIDWLRARHHVVALDDYDAIDESTDVINLTEQRDELLKIVDAIDAELAPEDSYLFRELLILERSFEDVARETGVPARNLHVRKHRLMRRVLSIAAKIRGRK